MSKIILYSNNCPRCQILKAELDKEDIEYEIVSDIDEIEKIGYKTVPILTVDGAVMAFPKAMKWVKKQSEGSESDGYFNEYYGI